MGRRFIVSVEIVITYTARKRGFREQKRVRETSYVLMARRENLITSLISLSNRSK